MTYYSPQPPYYQPPMGPQFSGGMKPPDPAQQRKVACCLSAVIGTCFLFVACTMLVFFLFFYASDPKNETLASNHHPTVIKNHVVGFETLSRQLAAFYHDSDSFRDMHIEEGYLWDVYRIARFSLERPFPVLWELNSGRNFIDLRFDVYDNVICPKEYCSGSYCLLCEPEGCEVTLLFDNDKYSNNKIAKDFDCQL